ncbi:MAG: sulfide:quinone oxidoreductase [Polaribacter sp.]|jgi:sulfide:quinone oxidoreductase
MQIKQIEENFSISEQIVLEDIKTLSDIGIKILICNRPESEEANQLNNAEVITEAESHGIEFVHIPSAGREIPQESLALFVKTRKDCNGKMHAYCRTGARSSIFWGLAQAIDLPSQTVIENAQKVGFDLTGVETQLLAINQISSITTSR